MLLAQEFYLDKYSWNVKAFYVVDSIPIDYIIKELENIGCARTQLDKIIDNLTTGRDNHGITFSNTVDNESIIVIGETSCPAEFQHTFDHEKLHLAMHIAKSYNIDPYSEELAYLVGEIGLNMFQIAKKFLCEHCRKEII